MISLPVNITPLESFSATPEAIVAWSQRHIEKIKELFSAPPAEELPPVVIFLAPNPEDPLQYVEGYFPLWKFTKDDASKDVAASLLPSFFAQTKTFACLTVIEAWIGSNPDDLSVSVENMPDREEALVFLFETFDGTEVQSWVFSRENGGITFLHDSGADLVGVGGRFASLLHLAVAASPERVIH